MNMKLMAVLAGSLLWTSVVAVKAATVADDKEDAHATRERVRSQIHIHVHAGKTMTHNLDHARYPVPDSSTNAGSAGCAASPYHDGAHEALLPEQDETWEFESSEDGCHVERAARMRGSISDGRYVLHIDVYCRNDDAACRALSERARTMRVPRIVLSKDRLQERLRIRDVLLSSDHIASAYRDWQWMVAQEACTPGAVRRQGPEFPSGALSAGVSGTVRLLATLNSCGEVRDVLVEGTSLRSEQTPQVNPRYANELIGNAISTVMRWRMDPARFAAQMPKQARVPIGFSMME